MGYRIADDFEQHVNVRMVGTDGKIHNILMVGTRAQLVERLTKTFETTLEYGYGHELTVRPIHPMNVERLDKGR